MKTESHRRQLDEGPEGTGPSMLENKGESCSYRFLRVMRGSFHTTCISRQEALDKCKFRIQSYLGDGEGGEVSGLLEATREEDNKAAPERKMP